jgi:hypothetical protein
MSIESCSKRRTARQGMIAVLIAAVFTLISVPSEATPLDKLSGQSITVGNLIFSNFSSPNFVGAGPSNIDVQGVILIDPSTGLQQTGLRFVVIQSGVPKPFSVSPTGGPHEIVLNVDYSVTDTTGQLRTAAESIVSTVTGQAGVFFSTGASPSQAVADGSLVDPTLTLMFYENWFGTLSANSTSGAPNYAVVDSDHPSFSAPLFPGVTTFYVHHQVQLATSNRKGITGGTVTLQGWDSLFSE